MSCGRCWNGSTAGFLKAEAGLDTRLWKRRPTCPAAVPAAGALARRSYDSPVYIFDEATSKHRRGSENDIMAEIHRLAKHKTVILISHRLANVVQTDNIYVLDGGNIAEHAATIQELLKNHVLYERLWNAQQALKTTERTVTQMKRQKRIPGDGTILSGW